MTLAYLESQSRQTRDAIDAAQEAAEALDTALGGSEATLEHQALLSALYDALTDARHALSYNQEGLRRMRYGGEELTK